MRESRRLRGKVKRGGGGTDVGKRDKLKTYLSCVLAKGPETATLGMAITPATPNIIRFCKVWFAWHS
jgi:hypothetical protein